MSDALHLTSDLPEVAASGAPFAADSTAPRRPMPGSLSKAPRPPMRAANVRSDALRTREWSTSPHMTGSLSVSPHNPNSLRAAHTAQTDSVLSRLSLASALEGHEGSSLSATICPTLLRRERELLDAETSFFLNYNRERRRRDPTRCLDKRRQDYVYYNHRSKGCYIPHEKPQGTATLTYNHLFDFADGTRFYRTDEGGARPNPSVVDPRTGTFKSLTASSSLRRAIRRSSAGRTGRAVSATPPREVREPRTISVDVARSLRVSDLRVRAVERRVAIETVVAESPSVLAAAAAGVLSVVAKGKVPWGDLPPDLQRSLSAHRTRTAAAAESANANAWTSVAESGLPAFRDGMYRPSAADAQSLGVSPDKSRRVAKRVHRQRPMQPVKFTDATDQVLLGFTEHVLQPVITRDGIPSYYYTREGEEAEAGGESGTLPRIPSAKVREGKGEKDKAYETSRLRYNRLHDAERAANEPPPGMTTWSTLK